MPVRCLAKRERHSCLIRQYACANTQDAWAMRANTASLRRSRSNHAPAMCVCVCVMCVCVRACARAHACVCRSVDAPPRRAPTSLLASPKTLPPSTPSSFGSCPSNFGSRYRTRVRVGKIVASARDSSAPVRYGPSSSTFPSLQQQSVGMHVSRACQDFYQYHLKGRAMLCTYRWSSCCRRSWSALKREWCFPNGGASSYRQPWIVAM